MREKKIGVFSSVESGKKDTSGKVNTVSLSDCCEDSSDTVYNILFKEYDDGENE